MRVLLIVVVAALAGCSLFSPAPGGQEGEGEVAVGEGEVVGEGEGDVVGEGEGDVVGEGEGDVVVGEGEGEGEGDVVGPECVGGQINSVTESGEQCDDGNAVNGDGCDVNCTFTDCGNAIVTDVEACDDGNSVNGDGCDVNCTVSVCGNGEVSPTEECDDGNTDTDDPCSSSCTFNPVCGNSVIEEGELCDGGAGCEDCGLVVDVDNLVGEVDAAAVPVRVALSGFNVGPALTARGPLGQVAPVELAGGSAWFRVDLPPHSVTRWVLQAAPSSSDPFGDFSLHEHCSEGEHPTGPADEVCRGAVDLDAAAIVVGSGAAFVHAAWLAAPRSSNESVLSCRSRDISATVDLSVDVSGAFSLALGDGAIGDGPAIIDNAWHDVSVSVDDLTPTVFVDGNVFSTRGGPLSVEPPTLPVTNRRGGNFSTDYDELFFSSTPRPASWIQGFHRGLRGFVGTLVPVVDEDLSTAGFWVPINNLPAVSAFGPDGMSVSVSSSGGFSEAGFDLPLTTLPDATRLRVSALIEIVGNTTSAANGVRFGVLGDSADEGALFVVGGADRFISIDERSPVASAAAPLTGVVGLTLVVDRAGWWAQTSSLSPWDAGADAAVTASAWKTPLQDASPLVSAPRIRFVVTRSSAGSFVATLKQLRWTFEPAQ